MFKGYSASILILFGELLFFKQNLAQVPLQGNGEENEQDVAQGNQGIDNEQNHVGEQHLAMEPNAEQDNQSQKVI